MLMGLLFDKKKPPFINTLNDFSSFSAVLLSLSFEERIVGFKFLEDKFIFTYHTLSGKSLLILS